LRASRQGRSTANSSEGTAVSPRRTILRELNQRDRNGEPAYTRPSSIAGFADQPARFQQAVNQLLGERLINGTKDAEGRLAIAINEYRRAAVERELKPWYARPAALLLAVAAVAVLAVGFVLQSGS
jgi:hypothetical protein